MPDVRARVGDLPLDQFGRRPGQPAVGDADEFKVTPRLARVHFSRNSLSARTLLMTKCTARMLVGRRLLA